MKRRKRKLKKNVKKVLYLLLLLILIFIIKLIIPNNNNNKNITELPNENKSLNKTIQYEKYITKTSENNKDIVREYISNGMSLDLFKNALSRESIYVNKEKEYKEINYNFEKHLRYEELEEIYKNLNNSKIVKLEIIGKTFDGRNLYSIEIGSGKDTIMFEGNIHAAEIAPTLFLTKFAVDLVNDWENGNEEINDLLTKHKILILPSANPDGYNYSIFGSDIIKNKDSYIYQNREDIEQDYYKANLNGVDLNRNFPSQTGGLVYNGNKLSSTTSTTKSTQRLSYYPGDSLGSEPETQALIYWMYKNYTYAHAYIAVHSAGRVIYNGKPHLSDSFNKKSQECAQIVNNFTNYTLLGVDYEDVGCGADGTSTDMIAEIANGFKLSEESGRLSYQSYKERPSTSEKDMCVLTIETMEKYTQDLEKIKSEFYNKNLENMFKALVTEIN